MKFGIGKGGFLAGALDLDELAVLGEDEVEIDSGVLVLDVVEIEHRLACDDADADGGDELVERGLGEGAGGDELAAGEIDGDAGAGDGGGTGATVGLEDVAIDPQGARAEGGEIDGGAEGAADEALDLNAAAIKTALGDIAGFALEGGIREHGILRRNPAAGDGLLFHPARDALLNGGGADDAGIAEGGENRAGGVGGDAGREGNGAELVCLAAIVSGHVGGNVRQNGRREEGFLCMDGFACYLRRGFQVVT